MNRIIIGFIIINMLFLASEHYDQSEQLNNIGEIANLFFTVIFTGEMVLKLFGLGIKKYVSDGFNVFDGPVTKESTFSVELVDAEVGEDRRQLSLDRCATVDIFSR